MRIVRIIRVRPKLAGYGRAIFPLPTYGLGYSFVTSDGDGFWPINDAPTKNGSAGGAGGATFPLPGGGTISVTVAKPNMNPPPASGNAVDRLKAWAVEQSILNGYPNWQVVGAGVLLLLALRRGR